MTPTDYAGARLANAVTVKREAEIIHQNHSSRRFTMRAAQSQQVQKLIARIQKLLKPGQFVYVEK